MNLVQEVFDKCDEIDPKGNRKVTVETIKRIVEQFKRSSELKGIADTISNNFMDFRLFFKLFLKVMRIYEKESEVYKIVV